MRSPLLRSESARLWVAGVVGVVALVAAVVVLVRFDAAAFGSQPLLSGELAAAVVLVVAGSVAGWALATNRRPTVVNLGAAAITVLALVLVAVLAVRQGLHGLADQAWLGTTSSSLGRPFLVAGGAGIAIAAVLVVVRWPPTRVPVTALVAVAGIAVVGAVGTAVTVMATSTGCESFRFDPVRWHEARARTGASDHDPVLPALADAVARCGIVTGTSPSTVRAQLGAPDESVGRRATPVWRYRLGIANDPGYLLGGGDKLSLIVSFGSDGRVRDARTHLEPYVR